jgi:hypothetical protein
VGERRARATAPVFEKAAACKNIPSIKAHPKYFVFASNAATDGWGFFIFTVQIGADATLTARAIPLTLDLIINWFPSPPTLEYMVLEGVLSKQDQRGIEIAFGALS